MIFHNKVSQIFAKQGWFDFSFLKLNGKSIAFRYGFRYKNKFFAYNTSYDSQYHKLSPGRVLTFYVIKELIDGGIKEFDLLRGGESYKMEWTSSKRENLRVLIFKKTVYSRLLHLLLCKIKPTLGKYLKKTGK